MAAKVLVAIMIITHNTHFFDIFSLGASAMTRLILFITL